MAERKIKIVTIGGGSSYTPELFEGLIKRKDKLPIKEIYLVDIEEGKEKLEIVGSLARRMVKAAGLDWEVKLTTNRREALKDADYVTTQFRVGLLDARVKDEIIPLSHGVLGQETNGAGGMFKAFRTIPVILDIIKDMEELCPKAWLINFTNPAGMVTEAAIYKGGWDRTIGLCNVPIAHEAMVAKALGIPKEDLFIKYAGLNHFHWHRVWDKDGNERTEEVIELLYNPEKKKEELIDVRNVRFTEMPYELLKDLKILPCAYHRYYYTTNDMLELSMEEFEGNESRAQVVKELETSLFELYKNEELDHKPEELEQRGGRYYSDAACELIASIENDSRTQLVVSTKNNGTISDLPYDCVIEGSSIITGHGAEPYNWGKFESGPRGLLQIMKAMEQMTIEAAITGDYNKALHAININPLVPSGKIAQTLLDQLLYAHKDYLPQFEEKIKEIEKNQPEVKEYVDNLMEKAYK